MRPSAEDSYLFHHALTRQGAYDLMPPSVRAQLHEVAAACLESGAESPTLQDLIDAAQHVHHAIVWSGGYPAATRAQTDREIDLCTRAADAATRAMNADAAIELWERIAASPGATRLEAATALIEVTGATETRSRFADGERAGLRALAMLEDLPEGQERTALELRATHYLAAHAARTSRFDVAKARAERAHAIAMTIQHGADEMMARVQHGLGLIHMLAGERAAAQSLLEASLSLSRRLNLRGGMARTMGVLGNIYLRQGHADEARAILDEARTIATEAGDADAAAVALGNAANVLLHCGKLQEAAHAYESAIAELRATGNRLTEGAMTQNLAMLRQEQGDSEAAARGFQAAIVIACEVGAPTTELGTRCNLALLHMKAGRYDESEAELRGVVSAAHALGLRVYATRATGSLGYLHRRQKRYDEAEREIDESVAMYEAMRDPRSLGVDLLERALLRAATGRRDLAEADFRRALDLLKSAGAKLLQATVMRELAAFLRASGRAADEADALEREADQLDPARRSLL